MRRESKGQGLDRTISAGEKAGGQYLLSPPLAQQVGHSREPHTIHPPTGSSALRHQPTRPSNVKFCCLAGKGRLSQLWQHCFCPTVGCLLEPVQRSPSSLQGLRAGCQAQCISHCCWECLCNSLQQLHVSLAQPPTVGLATTACWNALSLHTSSNLHDHATCCLHACKPTQHTT